MRKLLVATAGVLAIGGAGIALAQPTFPTVTVQPTVSSTKAGTKSNPKGVTLKTVWTWQKLGANSQPDVIKFLVKFPKGSLWQGAKYPSCPLKTISRPSGPKGCPPASIIGSGSGIAYADVTITKPKIIVVNGGAKTIYFYTELNNPGRVYEPVVGTISPAGGAYAYTLTTTVPQNLRIVAGTPIELTNLTVTVGHGAIIATTACPGGKWPYFVTSTYLNESSGASGSASYNSTIHCS
jgi:hypothetical protein